MSETPPDGSTAPAQTELSPEFRRRSRWLLAGLAGGLVVVLAAAGTRAFGVWGSDSEPEPQSSPVPTQTEPASPFDGTPAENFAEGVDGIVLPEAEAIGDFTAGDVEDALELVRDALVAARLDEAMLLDHNPKPFLQLLAQDQRSTVGEAFDSGDFRRYATHVASDSVLAPIPPRVEGRIAYTTKTDGGLPVLEVSTQFVWAYPLVAPEMGASTHLVLVRDEIVWIVRSHGLWLETSQGLWLPDAASNVWGADCRMYGDGLVRPASEPWTVSDYREKTTKIFDPEQPLDSDDAC